MQLFLTSVLPFLAHDHPSAAAFLTCRCHNFHGSIIPEFLSDEERVRKFCEARQQNELDPDKEAQHANLYNLFVQTPLMQFSPSLVLRQEDCAESIVKQLLETKYFTRTLQRCSFSRRVDVPLTTDLLQALSKVQSLTNLDLGWRSIENRHLESIINSFPSLETLAIGNAYHLKTGIKVHSPPPPATKTLRSLRLDEVHALFATAFVPHFPNLRKLALSAHLLHLSRELDLRCLSSCLPLLTDLSVEQFILENTESLQNLVHLSSLELLQCRMPDSLSFLTQDSDLPHLTTLRIEACKGLSSSQFASLVHAPNLHDLALTQSDFDNDSLQYLENMVHLRKLDLSCTYVVGDSRSLKTLIQNLFQLEELSLLGCRIGNQGAIAGALYSIHSRLRDLKLGDCDLVDDDLNGIGALQNSLEVLDLSGNSELTSEGLRHCKDLVKLKVLKLWDSNRINDLSSLKDCLNLEELNVSSCRELTDDSFKVFSEEPNSFPNLQVLDLSNCDNLTEKAFEHLSKNNNLVYRLKELRTQQFTEMLSSSMPVRNSISQLTGLRRLIGVVWDEYRRVRKREINAMTEFIQRLRNLEEID